VTQYDTYLRGFQNAAIQTERLSALLNAGQAIILSVGLTLVLIAAVVCNPAASPAAAAAAAGAAAAGAAGVAAGGAGGLLGSGLSPGDLVMIQGLLLQLWAPLQFLGWFYR
jgi:ABC-type transport system involved in Fe-S cluster assembly fused permease/ATPase subunit